MANRFHTYCLREQKVAGSNPVTPTTNFPQKSEVYCER